MASLGDKLKRFNKKYGKQLAAGGVSVLTGNDTVGGVLKSIFGPPAATPPSVPSGDTGNNPGFIGPTEPEGPGKMVLLLGGAALLLFVLTRK